MADTSRIAPTVMPATPAGLLRQIDGWLANTNHGSGHPWRQSIAATLAAEDRAQDAPEPAYEPFKWHSKADEARPVQGFLALPFAGRTRDIAAGAAVVLGMLDRQRLTEEDSIGDDGRPLQLLMSVQDSSDLLRLALGGLQLLRDDADDFITRHRRADKLEGADHGRR
jgi:hypothetical protein